MTSHRLAACSWSLRPRNPDQLIELARRTGLNAVQLALSPIVAEPSVWGGTVGALGEAGITILSGMMQTAGEDYSTLQTIARTGGVRPDGTWPANEVHAAAVADLAAAAGIRLVTFHAGFIPEDTGDPERVKLLRRLRIIADLLGERDLRLGLETGQETADTLLDALGELDRPNVGVNFDPANMVLYGKGDPVDALRKLAPRVVQIHIKDALPAETSGSWGTEVPVGQGCVDWPAFFATALAIDPPVDLIIEREAGDDRLSDIRAAVELVESSLP